MSTTSGIRGVPSVASAPASRTCDDIVKGRPMWPFRESLGAAGGRLLRAGALDDAEDVTVERRQGRLRRGRPYAGEGGHSSSRR